VVRGAASSEMRKPAPQPSAAWRPKPAGAQEGARDPVAPGVRGKGKAHQAQPTSARKGKKRTEGRKLCFLPSCSFKRNSVKRHEPGRRCLVRR